MKLKAFMVRCTCPGEKTKHDESNKECPTELFMQLVISHDLFPHLVHDVLDCEAMDAPIEAVEP